ncbi:PAS domain S-box protein [Roseomonas frigidaquae]|uniref:histidine kinase n=1 Tax=Falsiroseomonas frigidaquae TaxID=487318 RepID=A0ABX1EUK4_9PROT|nr:PAS domain-containing sensor histidine kinase [Falsiroseomonas frigidaquae]NKE44220.1 PAS domain S-box protein [Falsiroseomonas frigidaquae]
MRSPQPLDADLDCVVEALGDSAVIRLSPEGDIRHLGAAAARLLGHVPEAVLGRHFRLFYPPEALAADQPAVELNAARRDGRCAVEAERLRQDGTRFQAASILLARSDPAEPGFLLVLRDLTARERLRQELEEAQQEVERRLAELALLRRASRGAGEERFRQVVEAAPNAMVMINAAGQIEMVNAQAERVFGYRRDEMLGRPVDMLVPEGSRDLHPALRRGFFAQPQSRPMGAGRDLHGLRKDGSEFPVEIGLNPIETEDGPMVLSAILDMSARVQLEALLRQAQKMEAVGRLTAGVAHDFNNLLQTMMGSMEILQDRVLGDLASEELVASSIDAALRGARLTHHLLAFSRKQVLRPSQIEIAALLRKTVAMLERTLGPKIRIRALEEAGAPAGDQAGGLQAFADPAQLEACILNLAINARDAMPRGGSLTIRAYGTRIGPDEATETLQPGDYAVLSVEDTGSGIKDEILDKIFEPFFTTKDVGEGSGLGLPMVLGYARQSGGDVRVASLPGQGTRVEVLLPRIAPAEPAAEVGRPGPVAQPGCGRVLLVDDAPDVLQTLGAFLSGAGYEVTRCASGDEALQVVAEGAQLDCVVTDYAMPGLSGVDLLLRLAELRPGLPVLVVTGYPGVEPLGDLPQHVEILRKPFPRAELLRRVAALVAGRVGPRG